MQALVLKQPQIVDPSYTMADLANAKYPMN